MSLREEARQLRILSAENPRGVAATVDRVVELLGHGRGDLGDRLDVREAAATAFANVAAAEPGATVDHVPAVLAVLRGEFEREYAAVESVGGFAERSRELQSTLVDALIHVGVEKPEALADESTVSLLVDLHRAGIGRGSVTWCLKSVAYEAPGLVATHEGLIRDALEAPGNSRARGAILCYRAFARSEEHAGLTGSVLGRLVGITESAAGDGAWTRDAGRYAAETLEDYARSRPGGLRDVAPRLLVVALEVGGDVSAHLLAALVAVASEDATWLSASLEDVAAGIEEAEPRVRGGLLTLAARAVEGDPDEASRFLDGLDEHLSAGDRGVRTAATKLLGAALPERPDAVEPHLGQVVDNLDASDQGLRRRSAQVVSLVGLHEPELLTPHADSLERHAETAEGVIESTLVEAVARVRFLSGGASGIVGEAWESPTLDTDDRTAEPIAGLSEKVADAIPVPDDLEAEFDVDAEAFGERLERLQSGCDEEAANPLPLVARFEPGVFERHLGDVLAVSDHPSRAVREKVLGALGLFFRQRPDRVHEAVDVVGAALRRDDRSEIVVAISLVNTLADEAPEVATSIVRDHEDRFHELFDASDPVARNYAAVCVGEVGEIDHSVAELFLGDYLALCEDESPGVRGVIAENLGGFSENDPEAVAPHLDAVAPLLDDEDAVCRYHATVVCRNVIEVDPDAVAPHLGRIAPLFGDKVESIRRTALETFGEFADRNPAAAGEYLDRAGERLRDESGAVRAAAASALARFAFTDRATDLEPFAGDLAAVVRGSGGPERLAALLALGSVADTDPDRFAESVDGEDLVESFENVHRRLEDTEGTSRARLEDTAVGLAALLDRLGEVSPYEPPADVIERAALLLDRERDGGIDPGDGGLLDRIRPGDPGTGADDGPDVGPADRGASGDEGGSNDDTGDGSDGDGTGGDRPPESRDQDEESGERRAVPVGDGTVGLHLDDPAVRADEGPEGDPTLSLSVEVLAERLGAGSPAARRRAAGGFLTVARDRPGVAADRASALARRLRDPDGGVRDLAVGALVEAGQERPAALAAHLDALADQLEHPRVRTRAKVLEGLLAAAAERPDPVREHVPAVVEVLRTDEDPVRFRALSVVGFLAREEARAEGGPSNELTGRQVAAVADALGTPGLESRAAKATRDIARAQPEAIPEHAGAVASVLEDPADREESTLADALRALAIAAEARPGAVAGHLDPIAGLLASTYALESTVRRLAVAVFHRVASEAPARAADHASAIAGTIEADDGDARRLAAKTLGLVATAVDGDLSGTVPALVSCLESCGSAELRQVLASVLLDVLNEEGTEVSEPALGALLPHVPLLLDLVPAATGDAGKRLLMIVGLLAKAAPEQVAPYFDEVAGLIEDPDVGEDAVVIAGTLAPRRPESAAEAVDPVVGHVEAGISGLALARAARLLAEAAAVDPGAIAPHVRTLARCLADGDELVTVALGQSLGDVAEHDPGALGETECGALLSVVGDKDDEPSGNVALDTVRRVATDNPSPLVAHVDALVDLAATTAADRRARVLYTLDQVADAEPGAVAPHLDPLVAALRDEETIVRRISTGIVRSIADERPAEAATRIDEVLAGLRDDDWIVRREAAGVASAIAGGDPGRLVDALDAVVARFEDEESGVRRNATSAVARVAPARPDAVAAHLPAIEARLDDSDPAVARNATLGLKRLVEAGAAVPGGEAVERLVADADDRSLCRTRTTALVSVARAAPAAVEPHRTRLRERAAHRDARVAVAATTALAHVPDESSIELRTRP